MAVITLIKPQKRAANRRSVYLDGHFAFGCNVNVIARFRLREGMALSDEDLRGIEQGELRQECFDRATRALEHRLHSRTELSRKLSRLEYPPHLIEQVLDDLARMGYVDDARFAAALAHDATQAKKHGPRRIKLELAKRGVAPAIVQQTLESVGPEDSLNIALNLAQKQAARLSKLDPQTARRRLTGMLLRRGFDYEAVSQVIRTVLQGSAEDES